MVRREATTPRMEKPLAAPWMTSLKKALNHGGTQRKTRDRSEAKRKHVQIATVDPESGRPAVRTVVSRGFLPQRFVDGDHVTSASKEESCCLVFITDDRSAKFAHLGRGERQGAPIECCWWLDEAGVQFRIAGRVLLATARTADPGLRAAVDEVWNRLGDSTRRQMYWPHPGAPKGEGAERATVTDAADEISLEASHFVVLIVVPDSVDELHLGGGQKRIIYRRDERTTADPGTLESLRGAVWSDSVVNP
jgi:pyridoxamine 5'-phosphate oxidase